MRDRRLLPYDSTDFPRPSGELCSRDMQAVLKKCFAQVIEEHIAAHFESREDYIRSTDFNRGHVGVMARGETDSKIVTLFRATRDQGYCPSLVVCETCRRFSGSCIAPLRPGPVPDLRTLRDAHLHCQPGRSWPPA